MALYATNRFHGDGTTTSYEFNFVGKYIARTHVKVYQEDNATKVRTYVPINDSNFLNDTTLRILPVTPVGSTLVIYRETPKPPLVDFVNGSRFTEYNLDLVARQGLFVAMEALDAGDSDARQQLLDAIAVAVGLVDAATAAVSDATAAALEAATAAANAASSASAANTAKVDAQAANTAAQAAKTSAETAAGNSASSALAASNSATAAAGSASTASTQAGIAGGRAASASTQATNAATSASAAAGSASAASTSAANAGTSATAAATSASAAAGSASAASASASTAAGHAASINPATFMTLANAQTVSGAKTFSIAPEVGNVSDPAQAPGKALNWASIRPRTILNGWGTQAGVTSNIIYMGWIGIPRGILAQVDVSPMGSVVTTAAASTQSMVGALAFGHYIVGGSSIAYGTQVAGSDLRASSVANFAGGALPGTWVCLGAAAGNATGTNTAAKTLFMRVA